MEIIETKLGEPDFHLFECVLQKIYPQDSFRFKELESINLEFLHACYVVMDGNEALGRAALYFNPALNYKAKKASSIGNFECVDDSKVSELLINHIAHVSREADKIYLIGPMNGSTWDNYRFSKHNEYPNFLLEPNHPLYYNQQFASQGFVPISNYTSSINSHLVCDFENVLRIEDSFSQAGVLIRNIDMANYENELLKLHDLVTSSFKTNFLYTPISKQTFLRKYMEVSRFINPEMVLIAEDSAENLIGFLFAYEDLYNQNEKCMVVKTIARNPDRKWSGLGHVMANQITRFAQKEGFKCMVHAFMIEDGTSTGVSKQFLGKVFKNYTLYAKKL